MKNLFTPFKYLDDLSFKALAIGQLILFLAVWAIAPLPAMPSLFEVLGAFDKLASQEGLLVELYRSALTISVAIFWSTVFSCGIVAVSTMTFFRPAALGMSTLRFLGFAGITFVFTMWSSSGAELKLWLLTFGMTVFLTTNLLSSLASIKPDELDYTRSLRLTPWESVYELWFRGRLSDIMDQVRQNAAIGWTLLSMVEGLVRSEGGIGSMLLNQNKHLHLAAIFAIQLAILGYGLLQDVALRYLRQVICPHLGRGGEAK